MDATAMAGLLCRQPALAHLDRHKHEALARHATPELRRRMDQSVRYGFDARQRRSCRAILAFTHAQPNLTHPISGDAAHTYAYQHAARHRQSLTLAYQQHLARIVDDIAANPFAYLDGNKPGAGPWTQS